MLRSGLTVPNPLDGVSLRKCPAGSARILTSLSAAVRSPQPGRRLASVSARIAGQTDGRLPPHCVSYHDRADR